MVDILLIGATGYTGGLIARYLATHRERCSFSFAIAGRSKTKLDKAFSDLSLSDIHVFLVDLSDDDSIQTLLREANPKVILTTAGPYMKCGKPLARACALSGTHYVDISGEALFVKSLIDELDTLATSSRAILIPSCGFDSVPSDTVAFLAALTLRKTLNSMDREETSNIGLVKSCSRLRARGGFSGGTIASSLNLLETVPRKDLVTPRAPDFLGPTKLRSPSSPTFVSSLPVVKPKRYGGFFPLVPYNISVVHRTRGLFQVHADKYDANASDSENTLPAYSDDYSYTEMWATPGPVSGFLLSFVVALFGAGLMIPPFRWLMKRVLPSPGEGPSESALAKGFIELRNIGISSPLPLTGKPVVIETFLRGRGDPGYALTAVMASEAALAPLAPQEKLPPLARRGGVLTPMTALGPLLIKRLSESGKFEFESRVLDDGRD